MSVVRKGKSGSEEIQQMMIDYRNNPPISINNSNVQVIKDYLLQKEIDLRTGAEKPIFLPKSNVLQFFLEDGSKISIRPSGTEPKIKFYFGVKTSLDDRKKFEETDSILNSKLDNIIKSLGLI